MRRRRHGDAGIYFELSRWVNKLPIDSHIHFIPPSLLERETGSIAGPSIVFHQGHQRTVYQRGKPVDSVVREFSRLDVIQSQSEDLGIERLVLSPWVAMLPLDEEPSRAADVCRRQNAAMAEAISGSKQLLGLAALPMQDADLALDVLCEAVELGLFGAEITPSCQAMFVGDSVYGEFWAQVEELGVVIAIHPSTRGLDMPVFSQRYLWNSLANPVETALAAAQLVLNGLLEKHARLNILLAHGGGAILSVLGRIEHSYEVRREVSGGLEHLPSWSFAKLYYDTITHDEVLLKEIVRRMGPTQVLLGTDHPFDMGEYVGHVEGIRELFDPRVADMILYQNAERLFWKA